jgi:hypothetical protein
VTRASASVRTALRPVRGSLRIALLRWLLWIAASLPGVWLTRAALARTLAREPYFVDTPALDAVQLLELSRRLRPMLASLLVGVALSWIALQFLTAGAALRLDPERRERLSLWRACCDGGSRTLLPYLRIALLAATLGTAAWLALGRGFTALADHGEIAGWTGKVLMRDLPLARAALSGMLLSTFGVFAFWLRIGIAAEGHARVRVVARRALRLCVRRPTAALAFHWLVAVSTLGAQAGVLLAWRTSTGAPSTSLWLALWMAVLLVSAYAWQWRVRAALGLWRSALSAPHAPTR